MAVVGASVVVRGGVFRSNRAWVGGHGPGGCSGGGLRQARAVWCMWCGVAQRGGAVCVWQNESAGVEEAGSMGGAWGLVQGSSFSHNQVGGQWGVQGCAWGGGG